MFGSDGSPIIQYIVIFAVIFTVLAAIVFLVRRLTGGGTALQSRGARARQPRLGIVDVYELDRARQLILLRRDNVEHLLLVGGPNDVVVERNIQRGQRPLPEATLRPEPVAEPLPDPLAEAGRLPEPPRAITEASARPVEPSFEMPVVVPAPVPHSQNAPPVRLPLDAGLIGGDEPGRDLPVPP
ncbi:MAG: flagellar biosynthetic protein FliO, partial [Parafilimonas terrae]|nr:flagellar biosynthetic protein FliO [Parafilimonas terrae]